MLSGYWDLIDSGWDAADALARAPPECFQGKKGGPKGHSKGHSKGQKWGSKGSWNGGKGHSKGQKWGSGQRWGNGSNDSKGSGKGDIAMEAEAPAGDSGGSGGSNDVDKCVEAYLNHPLIAPGDVSSNAASGAAAATSGNKSYSSEQLQLAQALKAKRDAMNAAASKGVKNAADGHFASKQK